MKPTPRQTEIARWVAKGLSNKQIAAKTGLTPATVGTYIQRAAARVGGSSYPRHRLTIWFLKQHSLDDKAA